MKMIILQKGKIIFSIDQAIISYITLEISDVKHVFQYQNCIYQPLSVVVVGGNLVS